MLTWKTLRTAPGNVCESKRVICLQMLQQQLAEVGSPAGHLRQDALVTRLAVAVAAPWAQLPTPLAPGGPTPMAIDGAGPIPADDASEQQYAAAAAQVRVIVPVCPLCV